MFLLGLVIIGSISVVMPIAATKWREHKLLIESINKISTNIKTKNYHNIDSAKTKARTTEKWAIKMSQEEEIYNELYPRTKSLNSDNEKIFISFLLGGLTEQNLTIKQQRFTEKFKNDLHTMSARFMNGEISKHSALIHVADTQKNGQWTLVPSLNSLFGQRTIFPLYLSTYTGNEKEDAEKLWEKLRNIEGGAIGTDSLGTFPKTIFQNF